MALTRKGFYVLATSLEAVSAIRQRCRDMEALFSDFHVGDVGVGVVDGYFGRWFGHLAVLRTCGVLEVGVMSPALSKKKKPRKSMVTGLGRHCGGRRGLTWPLVWPFGCAVDV
jgi:hypothetical protein